MKLRDLLTEENIGLGEPVSVRVSLDWTIIVATSSGYEISISSDEWRRFQELMTEASAEHRHIGIDEEADRR